MRGRGLRVGLDFWGIGNAEFVGRKNLITFVSDVDVMVNGNESLKWSWNCHVGSVEEIRV